MEILRSQTPRKYIGLSTEQKPLLGKNDIHSTLYETDTEKEYIWLVDGWKHISTSGIPLSISGYSDITLDAWGSQKSVSDVSVFHGMFTYDISPYMWIIYENEVEVPTPATTRANPNNGVLNLSSGEVPGDISRVESRRHPRYQPNRGIHWAASVAFNGANSDGILDAGLIVVDENGIFFRTKGDGNLYACLLDDGVLIKEELITIPFDLDPTKFNIYDIQAQWRGVGVVKFFIGNPSTGLLELVHEFNFLNQLSNKAYLRNPSLSAGFKAECITQEVTLYCGCVDISTEGGGVIREQYGDISAQLGPIDGGTGIIALRNPSLAPNGKLNTRDMRLARISITADKKSIHKAYLTRDASSIVGGTWNSTRTGSFVEYNTTFTSVNTLLMEEFSTFSVEPGVTLERDNPSKDTIDFFGIHGDHIVIVCDSGTQMTVNISIEWGEEI